MNRTGFIVCVVVFVVVVLAASIKFWNY